jgi:ESCRT-II complex subunit VPS36
VQVAATISQLAQPAPAAAAATDAVPVLRGTIPGLGPPLTASDVARAMGVPLTIAAEHLATAEQLGAVCRDDGPEGLRYFRNFFMDAVAPQGIAV